MTTATVVDQTGASTGEFELPSVFEQEVHAAVMHQALIRQLANARAGTHATKNRSAVRGGGKKPWRQKGTGRARQGSIRAPHWRGGGVVFGPTPRSYRQDMPRKQRRLALRSALAVKAQESAITVLDGFELEVPSTRVVAGLLREIEAGRRVLVVLAGHNEMFERSARNISYVKVVMASNLSVRDLITAETVLTTREAIEHIEEALAT